MSDVTLTAAQIDALRALATHKAHWHRYMGRFNPVPHWSLNCRRCTKQMQALIRRGFAERIAENQFGDAHALITEAGRDWLARNDR